MIVNTISAFGIGIKYRQNTFCLTDIDDGLQMGLKKVYVSFPKSGHQIWFCCCFFTTTLTNHKTSVNHTKNYGESPCFMGKSTNSLDISIKSNPPIQKAVISVAVDWIFATSKL